MYNRITGKRVILERPEIYLRLEERRDERTESTATPARPDQTRPEARGRQAQDKGPAPKAPQNPTRTGQTDRPNRRQKL